MLHEKFLADKNVDLSYSQFTRHVPKNVIKPKPEDWGSFLCMSCMNLEHKLEALRKEMPQIDSKNIIEKEDEELNKIYSQIESSGIVFCYLEWTKEREPTNGITKVNSYHAKRVACTSPSTEFVEKLRSDLTYLKEHTRCMISQFRRIKSIKNLVNYSNEV